MSVLSYFRAPFPAAKVFSAYGMPGVVVHIPLLLASIFIGFMLCWPHPMLRPLLVVWVLAGLYLGRDLAIFCHYAPLLTLMTLAAIMTVIVKALSISNFGASHVVLPAVLSLSLSIIFCLRVSL